MSQDPRRPTDISSAASPRDPIRGSSETRSSRRAIQQEIEDISQTLVAHGAGSVSTELALDLVLHEIVVEAREVTGATGAAIAWLREGEMVCRATTGDNAPQLGIRIDLESALARACINTGQVQTCRDANLDPKLSEGAYQSLGVRSILLAPIEKEGEILGLLHLFSSLPDAFGENEIHATHAFVIRCIEARTEAEEWGKEAQARQVRTESASNRGIEVRSDPIREVETDSKAPKAVSLRGKAWDFSNFMLLVAVLTVAIVLGWLLGWRKGTEQSPVPSSSPAAAGSQVAIAREPAAAAGSSSVAPSTLSGSTASESSVPDHSSGESAGGVPPGGLIIIEDGKVIYRGGELTANPAIAPSDSKHVNGLLHRVNPQYPPEAIARNIEGAVVLDVGVRANGSVRDVAVRSGDPLLAEAAIRAVKQWRFAASSAVGNSNERQTRVTIRFTLPAK